MSISKKVFAISLAIALAITIHPRSALAGAFDFSLGDDGSAAGNIDTTGIFNELLGLIGTGEGGFGLDTGELQNTLKTTNAMNYKKSSPSVTLTFAPTSPVPGANITAVATPVSFGGSPKSLYFTWMLKRGYCHDGDVPSGASDKEKSCDANDDGEVDVEDYKIAAMRLLASGDFDWKAAKSSGLYDTASPDDDGFSAPAGGPSQDEKPAHCFVHSFTSGTDIELGEMGEDGMIYPKCFHLFPKKYYIDRNGEVRVEEDGDGNDLYVGDSSSSFSSEEEEFWHTDPTSQDTANSGTSDEEALSGLGKMSFSWTYTAGDKIGIIVEGASVESTIYKDSSYKIMWAMLGNQGTDEALTSNPLDADGNVIYSGKTMDDLNSWAGDSMIEPAKGNSDKKQDITLTYSPTNPTVSPGSSDELVVQSSVINDDNQEFTDFSWDVSLNTSSDYDESIEGDGGWQAVSDEDLAACTGTNSTSSIGLDSLEIDLGCLADLGSGFEDQKFYARVRLNTSENVEGLEKKGMGAVIVPIQSSDSSIAVYSTNVTGSNASDVSLESELCTADTEKTICPVTTGQIVGMKITVDNPSDYKFAWTLNGEPLPVQTNSNEATFPVLNEAGATYTLKADYAKNTGEKVTMVKTFKVVAPTAGIASADESSCSPLLLGNYIDLDNKYWPDYSQDSFEAIQGKTIRLKPFFNTTFSEANWIIDGTVLTSENASALGASVDGDGTLNLKIEKDSGYSYSVGMEAVYSQTLAAKKYLVANEGVSPTSFEEKNVSKTISIAVVDQFSSSTGKSVAAAPAGNKKVLASLFSGLPAYINFLFRIIVTMALILFSASLLSSLFPKQDQS
jgi:hypothetical protein